MHIREHQVKEAAQRAPKAFQMLFLTILQPCERLLVMHV